MTPISNVNNLPYYLNLTTFNHDPPWLKNLYFACNLFAFLFGLTICTILIFLTIKKSPKMFKDYSRLILMSVFIDLIFLIINFLLQPRYSSVENAFLSIMTGPVKYLPYVFHCHGSSFSSCIQESAFLITVYIYWYRLQVIKNKKPGPFPTIIYFVICLCILSTSYFTTYYSTCGVYEANKINFGNEWYKNIIEPKILPSLYTNKYMTINSSLYGLLDIICYFITIFITILTNREVKHFPLRFNSKTLDLHHQINRALFVQSLLPLSGILVPVLLYVISLIFGVTMEYGGLFTNICIVFHPLLSSFSNMIFISHYRIECLRPFKRFCSKSSGSLSNVVHIAAIPMFVVAKPNNSGHTSTQHT